MMSKSNLIQIVVLVCLLGCLCSCKKDTETRLQPAPPFATAGTNQNGIAEFSVKLNADSLKTGQAGKWTVASGLLEENKVYFDDAGRPDTRFHGMPGEAYVLKWTVSNYSESTVKVSFKPLQTSIINNAPDNQTQFYLSAVSYDSGEWTIEGGNYAYIRNQSFGGTVIPDINAPNVKFQAYAHRSYKLTWTTRYGSKSATASIVLQAGNYLESEALQELQVDPSSYRVTLTAGHVTGLDLSSSGTTWLFADTVANPAVQGLTYLKRLDLSGSATFEFPAVFGDRFLNLEYLNMDFTIVSSIPDNIGNLRKLKEFDLENLNQGAAIYTLPATFGQLESLEILRLGSSGIKRVPDSFGQLQNLRYCDLASNYLEYLPASIGNCKNLQHFAVVTQNGIEPSISKLSKLHYLYWQTAASTTLPADIGHMTALDTLDLGANLPGLPASFASLPLHQLRISGPGLPVLPENFGDLRNLDDLSLAGIYTVVPASFSKLSKLIYCTFSSHNLTALPTAIGNLKKLQYLECSYTQLSTLPASMGDLSALTELRLGQCKFSTLPESLFNLSAIKILDLGNNQLTTLPNEFQKLKNTLNTLYLQGNNYQPEDLLKIKQLLPSTSVYPY